MPRTKNGHNQTHDIKQPNNHTRGRTFTDNSDQQERLAKLLFQKEKEKNRNDNFFGVQLVARQRAQQASRHEAELRANRAAEQRAQQRWNAEFDDQEEIFGTQIWLRGLDLFAPNFNRHRAQQNQPFVERHEPANQDNHFSAGRPRVFRVFR